MQPVAPTPGPRGWWRDLSKTPGKLCNSDLCAKKHLWKRRYLELAVPPAKGFCCSAVKELSYRFQPWEAELARHSCCTSPLQQRWKMWPRAGWEQTNQNTLRCLRLGSRICSSCPKPGAQSLLNPILPRLSMVVLQQMQLHGVVAVERLQTSHGCFDLPLEGGTAR